MKKETQSLSLAASSPAEPYETPANAENRAIFTAEEFPFSAIVKPLTDWFNANKRDLPWRHDPTPYRVWVSEIMLQQTRVEAARDYYLRFLSALPAVEDLAYCEEDKLMKLWEGLGYYSRARNMQKTAKIVTETYGGVFPSDEKALRALPGIGDYTVGAIRSIAFGLPSPAVDGNVLRVCSRLAADGTDISDENYKTRLKNLLQKVYPETKQGCSDFTQSLMELGALICTPRVYSCDKCPLSSLCTAKKYGVQAEFPVLPEKKEKRTDEVWTFVIRTPNGFSVRKRESGVLKGMNEFPSFVVSAADADADKKQSPEERKKMAERLISDQGVKNAKIFGLKKYTHIFTHIRWNVTAFFVNAESSPFEEYTKEALSAQTAFPTAFRKCIDYIDDNF